jgi:hypothetical protein
VDLRRALRAVRLGHGSDADEGIVGHPREVSTATLAESPAPAVPDDSLFEQATTNALVPRRRVVAMNVLRMKSLRKNPADTMNRADQVPPYHSYP